MRGDAYTTNGMGENVLMNDDISQQAGEGCGRYMGARMIGK